LKSFGYYLTARVVVVHVGDQGHPILIRRLAKIQQLAVVSRQGIIVVHVQLLMDVMAVTVVLVGADPSPK
jgi:hypothetical protein